MGALWVPTATMVGSRAIWLFTMTWRGKVYRWSTVPVALQDGSEWLPYDGGLGETELTEALEDGAIDRGSIPVRVTLEEDLLTLAGAGATFATATGEIAMVTTRDGITSKQTYAQRFVVMEGRIANAQYGARGVADGTVGLSLEQSIVTSRARVIPATAVINSSTQPNAPTTSIGKVYPRAIGRPGNYATGGSSSTTSGSPAYVIADTAGSADTILGGYGHAYLPNSPTTCVVFAVDGDTTLSATGLTITNGFDSIGQPQWTVDVSGQSAAFRTSERFWIGMNAGAGTYLPYVESDHVGAGDIIRWLWAISDLDSDNGEWAAVAPFLNQWSLGFYVNDPDTAPHEVVIDDLLPMLPVEHVIGSRGIGAYLLERDLSPRMLPQISESTDFLFAGPYTEEDPGDVRTVSLRWALRARTGDYKRTTTLSAMPIDGDGDNYPSGNLYAASLAHPYRDAAKSYTTDVLYDEASAGRSAAYLAWKLSNMGGRVTFSVSPDYTWLAPGRQFAFSWSGKGVSKAVMRVRSRRWIGGRWELQCSARRGLRGLSR